MKTLAVVALALLAVAPRIAGQRATPSHADTRERSVPREVARVNGVAVMSDRVDAAVNRLVPLESFHRTVDPRRMAELRARALKDLVDQELEYQDGLRLGIRVSRSEVDAAVARAKSTFRSPQAFEDRLKASGATVADLRREIERSIAIQMTLDRVVTATCQVGDVEARRFFNDNQARFVVPEQLHVYAITIGVDPGANAQAWTSARTRAETVRRQIQDGASFEDMARAHSTDASKATGGDMGFVHRGSLNDGFEQALRGVPAGRVSEVVKTLYGYHLVRITEVRPPQKKTYADVAAEIRKDLTAKRCAESKDAWIARLRAAASIAP